MIRKLKFTSIILLTLLISITLFVKPCFAATAGIGGYESNTQTQKSVVSPSDNSVTDSESGSAGIDSETQSDINESLSEYNSEINSAYKVFRAISASLGAVAIAFNALKGLLGGEKDQQVAMKTCGLIFIAIAVLYFLPAVVQLGMKTFSGKEWTP